MAVLSVLIMTGEYSSGTIRASLAATPRRSVFYGAKVLVFGLLSVVLGFVLCFLSFFLGQAILKAGGAPTASLSTPGVLHVLVLSSLFFALLCLFGFGLGAVIRHTAGAIATFYGCTLLTALILQSVPGNPGTLHPCHDLRQLRGRSRPPRQRSVEHGRLPAHGPLHDRRRAGRGRALGEEGCMMVQQTGNDEAPTCECGVRRCRSP